MTIRLEAVNVDSWLECSQLQVKPEQERFITSNLFCIAEVQFYPDWGAYAIYHADQMVGFTMLEFNQEQEWWISSFMIAAAFQGKGYGRLALLALIELALARGCAELVVGYANDNRVARQLYQRCGFVELGLDDEGDMIARLRLSQNASQANRHMFKCHLYKEKERKIHMNVEIRRLQPGDAQLALRVVRDLIPVDERDGGEPTIGHLQRLLAHDTSYIIRYR